MESVKTEEYVSPTIEIIRFAEEDIITSSTCCEGTYCNTDGIPGGDTVEEN